MSQETVAKREAAEITISESKQSEKRAHASVQELVGSLKSVADDIGQISELSSEEKNLVTQFFNSLLKLMRPLATAIPVNISALPQDEGTVLEAYIDPTGHLSLMFQDGHMELKSLGDEQNRDLMMAVVEDVMPKFKSLTSAYRRKVETRIKLLTTVTKEIQKISETMPSSMTAP